jgi:hypothetical protein
MAPLGLVEIIDAVRRLPTGERIGIRAYGSIYNALGVTNDKFVAWQERYGFDSLGVGDDGSLLAPEFPVFSKVAWMYVDPVDLTASETKDLVAECEQAMSYTKDVAAKDELRHIRDLAVTATNKSATLRFGHP